MDAISALADTLMAASADSRQWAVGTITAVAAGAAADGNALATVTWQGQALRAAYTASYTPVVGHVVLMARIGPQLAIVGRLIGTPPST